MSGSFRGDGKSSRYSREAALVLGKIETAAGQVTMFWR
jgi:hypothetical protein